MDGGLLGVRADVVFEHAELVDLELELVHALFEGLVFAAQFCNDFVEGAGHGVGGEVVDVRA